MSLSFVVVAGFGLAFGATVAVEVALSEVEVREEGVGVGGAGRGRGPSPAAGSREAISWARRAMSAGGRSWWKRWARYSRIFWCENSSQEDMVPMWWKRPRQDCSATPVLV